MGKYLRQLDRRAMEKFAREKLTKLGLMTGAMTPQDAGVAP